MFNSKKHDAVSMQHEQKRVIAIRPLFAPPEPDPEPEPYDFSEERNAVVEQAKREARAILQEAETAKRQLAEEADQWKVNWEQEKEAIQQAAFEEAFETGRQQGQETGYQEVTSLIDEARSVVDFSKTEYEKNVERAERTIIELAVAVAEKIIHAEVEHDETRFLAIVKEALKEVRDQKEVQIHVHPSRYGLVIAQKDEIEALFPSDVKCYIFPNEEAADNTCFIETANGRIDAGIDTQLQQLRKQLLQLLEGEE